MMSGDRPFVGRVYMADERWEQISEWRNVDRAKRIGDEEDSQDSTMNRCTCSGLEGKEERERERERESINKRTVIQQTTNHEEGWRVEVRRCGGRWGVR
jgi:hypothetical protein